MKRRLVSPRKLVALLSPLVLCVGAVENRCIAQGLTGAGGKPVAVRMKADSALQAGKSLLDQKKYVQAIKMFKTSLGYDPDNANCWDLLGLAYQDSGDLSNAEKSYRTALTKTSKQGQIWDDLGCLYSLENKHGESIEAFSRAIKCGLSKDKEDEVRGLIEMEQDALNEQKKESNAKKLQGKSNTKPPATTKDWLGENSDINNFIQTGSHKK